MDVEAQKLAVLEEELRKDLEAITRVRQIMALKNGSLSRPDDRQMPLPITEQVADTISLQDDVDAGPATSLIGTIDQIINADQNVRWTTQKVLGHLQRINYPLRAQKPIYSVGQAIQKLVAKGRIRVMRHGTGSAPNIYKGKATEPTAAEDHSQGGDTHVDSTRTE